MYLTWTVSLKGGSLLPLPESLRYSSKYHQGPLNPTLQDFFNYQMNDIHTKYFLNILTLSR